MDTSKLKPNDPRVKYESAVVRGKTYSYILGEPQGPKRDTIMLCHGWPDMAFGWRYQIPYLMSLGFQVVAPNMLGYPGTSAPEDIKHYSLKSMSDDMKELAEKFVGKNGQVIFGGHDWGAFLVWRVAYWHPKLVKAIFNACVPAMPPASHYQDLEALTTSVLPNFRYQVQFIGSEPQDYFQGKDRLRSFFKIIHGTLTTDGRPAFKVSKGFDFDRVPEVTGECATLTAEEIEHYVEQYSRNEAPELRGTLNWYRNRKITFDEERERAESGYAFYFKMPTLFFAATDDAPVPPSMSRGMKKYFANLTEKELKTSHWIMTDQPEELNHDLGNWLDGIHNGILTASL